MYAKSFLFVLVGFFCFSCSNSVLEIEERSDQNALEGFWINGEFADSIYTCQRADSLLKNQYCFGFEADGVFVENKNAGWCGTPPIYYERYTGEWSLTDSIVHISVPYWGGMSDYTWKIVEVNNDQLLYLIVETKFEHAEE